MNDQTFVQLRAYIHAYNPEEEMEFVGEEEHLITDEEDDNARGVVIIDILGE